MRTDLTKEFKKCLKELCNLMGSKLHIEKHACDLKCFLKVTSEIPVVFANSDVNPWLREGSQEDGDAIKETLTLVLLLSNHMEIILKNLPDVDHFQKVKVELIEFHQMADLVINWCRQWNKEFTEHCKQLEQHLSTTLMPNLSSASEEIKSLISEKNISFNIKESKLFCDILGFQPRYAEYLQNFTYYELQHEPPPDLFQSYLHMSWFKFKDEINIYVNGDSLKQLLVDLGLTTERSNTLVDTMDGHFLKSQTAFYWAQKHLYLLFDSHPLLSSYSVEPPYKPHVLNEWFYQRIERKKAEAITHCDIQMINTDRDIMVMQKLQDMERIAEEKGRELLFHGTALHQYAKSILEIGIKLYKVSFYKDFSNGNAFYLTDDFETARKWGSTMRRGSYAVLVFSVQREGLSDHFLDLKNNRDLWKRVVRYFCFGSEKEYSLKSGIKMSENPGHPADDQDSGTNQDKRFKLKTFELIKGPICLDLTPVVDDLSVEAPVFHKDSTGREVQQLCIKAKRLAREIGTLENIAGVFWFL